LELIYIICIGIDILLPFKVGNLPRPTLAALVRVLIYPIIFCRYFTMGLFRYSGKTRL
jgi:hypothetical protein